MADCGAAEHQAEGSQQRQDDREHPRPASRTAPETAPETAPATTAATTAAHTPVSTAVSTAVSAAAPTLVGHSGPPGPCRPSAHPQPHHQSNAYTLARRIRIHAYDAGAHPKVAFGALRTGRNRIVTA
ncbi:hypothetical protein GCM10010433_72890 [Streptomyces pulveraceus]